MLALVNKKAGLARFFYGLLLMGIQSDLFNVEYLNFKGKGMPGQRVVKVDNRNMFLLINTVYANINIFTVLALSYHPGVFDP